MPGPTRPDSERMRAVVLQACGWSQARIARHLGVVTSTVARWVDPEVARRHAEQTQRGRAARFGVCLDCGGETRYSGTRGRTTADRCPSCEALRRRTIDRGELLRLRVECQLTTGEIAALLGCSQPRVAKILQDLGMSRGRGWRPGLTVKRRYIVRATQGYPITAGAAYGTGYKLRTSYSVLDSEYLYREVKCFYVADWPGEARRRRLANKECSRLNAIDQLARLAELSA